MGINVSAITYFKGAAEAGSADLEWVGYEKGRRVVRYTLEVTGAGATALTLVHKYSNYYDSVNGYYTTPALCASISTDSEAFINANGTESGCQAEMVKDTTAKTYTVSLSDLKLYPGQIYYLWVYPMTDDYAFAFYESAEGNWELASSGSVSVACIGDELYLPIIWNGTAWEVCVLILRDGTAWKICSQEG